MKGHLKDHPKIKWQGISTWPPSPSGSHRTGEIYLKGGEGKLADVRILDQDWVGPRRLSVKIEYQGREYWGQIPIDDPDIVNRLYEFLKDRIDQPISEIGEQFVDL